ncbi:MAG: hypothetical protein J6B41_07070 [Alistipes sp.]|nr:hypothetical protein [Alistipes sp.]
MIHEEICTYEVCKLAKEKGFGEMASCYQGYRKDGTLFYFSNMPDGKERVMQTDCLAPTQSLLQRWLREEKNIDIAIVPLYTGGYSYIVYNIHCRDNRVVNTNAGYDTYELALEDALKYALENLI